MRIDAVFGAIGRFAVRFDLTALTLPAGLQPEPLP
jgi:hypothetical protein